MNNECGNLTRDISPQDAVIAEIKNQRHLKRVKRLGFEINIGLINHFTVQMYIIVFQ